MSKQIFADEVSRSEAVPRDRKQDRVLICGAGNVLLSDDGFGVHFIRHLKQSYVFPPNVELLDAGTLGILVINQVEEAKRVYIVDCVTMEGEPPGSVCSFDKGDFRLPHLPVKLSPHQAGLQELLLLAELRGRCPKEVRLLGVVPESMLPGTELTSSLRHRLEQLARDLVEELRAEGLMVKNSRQG